MKTAMEIRREIRFAVVMYGGVSLAIYINGVAQELMRMVRATAPDPEDPSQALLDWDGLNENEHVYRKLGQLIGREGDELVKPWNRDDPIRTRFIVDILSGTSAGGINAVYLAKALANDQPIVPLEKLWLNEGDIADLLNDSESKKRIPGLTIKRETKSLLNGERMFRLLLEALDGMSEMPQKERSPYSEKIDLFVTTTDIHGLPVRLDVAGGGTTEKRHRNVFRFSYNGQTEKPKNDFTVDNNIMLAFAARCTSSFPFAFEPMRLVDIDPILAASPKHDEKDGSENMNWSKFFPAYQGKMGADYKLRVFGDGGYLDNKPFSYAIDALAFHGTGVPVDRKLIYIEPKPANENSTTDPNPAPPNAIENVAAALGLPGYETIREDLERVIERNQLIDRVDKILAGMEEDVWSGRGDTTAAEYIEECSKSWKEYVQSTSGENRKQFGVQYAGYERLETAIATDDLTTWIARACDATIDEGSADFRALQYLVRVWRDRRYPTSPGQQGSVKGTRRDFLFHFNQRYRLRRLNFVIQRIDRLHVLGAETERVMGLLYNESLDQKDEGARKEFRKELFRIREGLVLSLSIRLKTRHELESGVANPISPVAEELISKIPKRTSLLEEATEEHRLKRAEELLSEEPMAAFEKLDDFLRSHLGKKGPKAAKLDADARIAPKDAGKWASRANEIVNGYWGMFTYYDVISFPILHTTNVGELSQEVDIVRVSPMDAPSLIDERGVGGKLAGTALMNFGGFLDRSWRWNDILWGKLDGMERLVTVLLPGSANEEVRNKLVQEAQGVIISQALEHEKRDRSLKRSVDKQVRGPQTETDGKKQENTTIDPIVGILDIVDPKMDRTDLPKYFVDSYQVATEPEPQAAMRSLARGTKIVGKMLGDISQQYGVSDRPAMWLTRFGRFLWGLVEIAVPKSMGGLVLGYWLRLLYVVEILLIAAGIVFTQPSLIRFGGIAFTVTFAVNVVVWLIADAINGRHKAISLLKLIVVLVLAGLVVLGLLGLPDFLGNISEIACRFLTCDP